MEKLIISAENNTSLVSLVLPLHTSDRCDLVAHFNVTNTCYMGDFGQSESAISVPTMLVRTHVHPSEKASQYLLSSLIFFFSAAMAVLANAHYVNQVS